MDNKNYNTGENNIMDFIIITRPQEVLSENEKLMLHFFEKYPSWHTITEWNAFVTAELLVEKRYIEKNDMTGQYKIIEDTLLLKRN